MRSKLIVIFLIALLFITGCTEKDSSSKKPDTASDLATTEEPADVPETEKEGSYTIEDENGNLTTETVTPTELSGSWVLTVKEGNNTDYLDLTFGADETVSMLHSVYPDSDPGAENIISSAFGIYTITGNRLNIAYQEILNNNDSMYDSLFSPDYMNQSIDYSFSLKGDKLTLKLPDGKEVSLTKSAGE